MDDLFVSFWVYGLHMWGVEKNKSLPPLSYSRWPTLKGYMFSVVVNVTLTSVTSLSFSVLSLHPGCSARAQLCPAIADPPYNSRERPRFQNHRTFSAMFSIVKLTNAFQVSPFFKNTIYLLVPHVHYLGRADILPECHCCFCWKRLV